ncbi:MAG: osmotically inducible protein OsmC [Candidatus Marinimicrobia bacterium]|jgi:ribosomal protein S12 methylthiotransferase accessory factor|nr:osmotically inducible protein OsmC [Candidatus Neomarinimicrobiota bacterium]MBT3633170.1 osmotically inducible protein OsmC [Candidatus Neomarinimicrobiota bacterium]MBT3682229.1 osmotically inducible protein OsmC [Candidatus Neomarinimicrobiota bacterium]MBT3758770.1 osmotically inducible protein OsmC [Candidatus Neomarinimicrobiota bacterium]MBT3895356.1 osmotically inducible protein OsmC [Candidatus Neomarinimicrobiota bacterium]
MKIYFPGGKKVYADFNGFTHKTDQPVISGGDESSPAPFDMFLASLGTCAGIYVLGFCQQRNIDTEGIEIAQSHKFNPATKLIEEVNIEIKLPAVFPRKYSDALTRVAQMCAVKKHLENPPGFQVTTKFN